MSNPTTLLFPFNGTLAGQDRNGPVTATGVAPTRYAELGVQDGLWVETAGANLLPNPRGGVDATGWQVFSNRTFSRIDTLPAPMIDGLLSLVTTGFSVTADVNQGVGQTVMAHDSVTLSVNPYTASCYVYIPTAFSATALTLNVADLAGGTGTLSVAVNLSARDQWQRVVLGPFTPDAGDVICFTRITVTGGTWLTGEVIYATAWQIEQSAYATSYIDGSLGAGYAWTGTPHASTSTRAASSASVDQGGTARIDPASGSIASRYKRLIDTGAEEIILQCGTVGSGTDYLTIGVDASDKLYMEWNSNNAGAQRVTSTAANIAVDTEYFLYFDWDGTTIRLSVDNGALTSGTRAAVEGNWSTDDLVLSSAVGSAVIGPFVVLDAPLSAGERSRVFNKDTWSFNILRTGFQYHRNSLRPRGHQWH